MKYIGIDIGGTDVKFGVLDEKFNILLQSGIKTDREKTPTEIVGNIARALRLFLEQNDVLLDDVCGIGIGCPGGVNGKAGRVDFSPNLSVGGWHNFELVKEFKKHFKKPIFISNDANAAALGEASLVKYDSFVFLTLGTGVGSGIVLNGALFEGNEGKGAEIGHMTIAMGGRPCSCGGRGCMEAYCSATALIADTKQKMREFPTSKMWRVAPDLNDVDGKTAFEALKLGDAAAHDVVVQYISYLGESILNVINILRPEAVIIGGGVSKQGEFLLDMIKTYCEKRYYGYRGAPKTDILIAKLDSRAGLVGAAVLVNKNLKKAGGRAVCDRNDY
jgi:glucokinase